jgi:hypothetical protein
MGRNAKMISCSITIGCRFDNPVDVTTHQIEEFSGHHGDFTGIDPIGAEDRTAATLCALKEIIEPFLQNLFCKLPGSSQSTKNFSRECEISSID